MSVQFGYDALNQLVREAGSAQNEYGYDSVQNRIKKNQSANQLNVLNQLKSQLGNDYDYNLNGNLCNRRGSNGEIVCHYDALDRLIRIEMPQGWIDYRYDAFHRRTNKTYYKAQGAVERRCMGIKRI